MEIVDRERPLHLSIVGGDPLVRFREMEALIPLILARGVHIQLVTSAFRPFPAQWASLPGLNVVVSIDGLREEHDVRRTPATYDRILKNIEGQNITVHCTITAQMMQREGYLEEFLAFWTPRPEIKRVWFSIFTPQRGDVLPEILSPSEREKAVRDMLAFEGTVPEIGHASENDRGIFDAADFSGDVRVFTDDEDDLGGPYDPDPAVPVWRGSGLRFMWLYCLGGAEGHRRS